MTVWVGMKSTNRRTIRKRLILEFQGTTIINDGQWKKNLSWVLCCLLVVRSDICLYTEYWILQAQNADILWSMYIDKRLSSKKDKSSFLDIVRNAFMQLLSKGLIWAFLALSLIGQFEMKESWTQKLKLDPSWNLWGCYSCAITFKVTCKWRLYNSKWCDYQPSMPCLLYRNSIMAESGCQ